MTREEKAEIRRARKVMTEKAFEIAQSHDEELEMMFSEPRVFERDVDSSHKTLLMRGVKHCGDPFCVGSCGLSKLVVTFDNDVVKICSVASECETIASRSLYHHWRGTTEEVPSDVRGIAIHGLWN